LGVDADKISCGIDQRSARIARMIAESVWMKFSKVLIPS